MDPTELERLVRDFGCKLEDERACHSCSGSIPCREPMRIFYETRDRRIGVLQLPCDDPEALQGFLDACDEARFGLGKETLSDPTVRRGKTMPADRFACMGLDLASTDVLETIEKTLLAAASSNERVLAVPYTLNLYREGDHFAQHVDTPKDLSHLGSLVIALPQPFSGGELLVKDETYALQGKEQVAAHGVPTGESHRLLEWVAFFADTEHSVARVSAGTRITLSYDLFRRPAANASNLDQDLRLPLENEWRAFLEKIVPMLPGHVQYLGFGLQHAYPALGILALEAGDPASGFPVSQLRGADALTYRVLERLGMEIEIKAAYESDSFSRNNKYLVQTWPGSDILTAAGNYYTCLLLSDSFRGGGRDVEDSRDLSEILHEDCGAERRPEVYWCTTPTNRFLASSYAHYGNSGSVDYIYTAGALLVKVRSAPDPRYPNLLVRERATPESMQPLREPPQGISVEREDLQGRRRKYACETIRAREGRVILGTFVAEDFAVRHELHGLAQAIADLNEKTSLDVTPILIFRACRDAFDCHRLYNVEAQEARNWDEDWDEDESHFFTRCKALDELTLEMPLKACWALVERVRDKGIKKDSRIWEYEECVE
jgi:predicted 2-oxoglutarate/Fe(II)-dependent dioxygenase YbiX